MTKKIHRDGDEWQHHLKAILSKTQYNALVGELGCPAINEKEAVHLGIKSDRRDRVSGQRHHRDDDP